MKANFEVGGMSCSACSASVERAVKRIDGVTNVSVDLLSGRMVCEFESPADASVIIRAVEKAGFTASEVVPSQPKQAPAQEKAPSIKVRLTVSVVALVFLMYLSMGHVISLPFSSYFLTPPFLMPIALTQCLLSLLIVFVNRKFFIKGIPALFHGSANMDTLVSLGAGAALIYGTVSLYLAGYQLGLGNVDLATSYAKHLYFESAGMILTLVTVGKLLEERAKGKTDRALRSLMDLSPKQATVLRGGKQVTIAASDILEGDLVYVRPGQRIAIDGIVEEGASSLDTSALTGESIPRDCTVGDTVLSGSMNLQGVLVVRATVVGAKTTLSQIIALVQEACATKAPVSRLADRVSGIFVPSVLTISAITAIIWLIAGYGIPFAFRCAVSVLVVSCPCALGLATPVAMTVAMGKSAKQGILVKNAEAIERLHNIDTILLDKTGTVTLGQPTVTDWYAVGDEKTLFQTAASIEAPSEHPLSRAVCAHCTDTLPVTDFSAVFGKGVVAKVEGVLCHGGNLAYMDELGIDTAAVAATASAFADNGKTVLYFAKGGVCLGILAVSDPIKDSSRRAIARLHSLGLDVRLLTGDSHETASAISRELGIAHHYAQVLPQQKEAIVTELQGQGKRVAMVGDGINDSPALTRADVGIAIGQGTDIAMDSADIVLMKSDLCDVASAIAYTRRVMRNIRQNLFWAFFYNCLGIPIAAGALYLPFSLLLHPMIASAAMSCSSLFVVTNALRLNRTSLFEITEKGVSSDEKTNQN